MVSQAMRQIILIGVICFGTIGMFNAMSSIGNAGKHSPTAQNLVVTSSSIAYIIGFLLAGGVHNMLGPRSCVGFGGLTFFLYAGAMMLAKDNEHSLYPPLAGILLGLGAGCIWVTQGAMMMSYPTEDNKGKYIACFWAIFNLGAVAGSVLPLIMNNNPSRDPDDVSNNTYIVYMVIMGLATFLAVFLVRPSSIVRDDGEPIIVEESAGVKAEFVAILSVFCDWRMLLLIPAFFFSNFSYTYQFNDFNGFNFNIRTRSLNSILFWVAQIIGALMVGHLMDRLPMKRPRRAMLGLLFIAVLFMATWVGALMMQLQHKWQRKITGSAANLIDYEHGDSYPMPLAVYAMFGFCDAAFAVYCYWLMGALSNKHDELSRYAGFFKSIQSLGSAVAAPLDLAQTPLLAYLITNWILCAFSLAAMFLVCRTITDTTHQEEYEYEDGDDEDEDEDEEDMYEADDARCAPHHSLPRQDPAGQQQQHLPPSLNRSDSFDENLSTICATSEGSKTACGSRTSEQRSGCWRSNSRLHDYEDKDLDSYSSPQQRLSSGQSGLCSHDSYMSSASAVSGRSKRRSSSVLSSASIADPTTCPSPTYQHPHQQIRRSASRLSRVPPMAEIQDGAPSPAQQLSVPPAQGSSRIPSISLTTDGTSGARSGIGSSTAAQSSGPAPTFVFSHEFAPSLPPLPSLPSLPSASTAPSAPFYPLPPHHNPYLFLSWATGPPPQAPPGPSTMGADLQPHNFLTPDMHQAGFGGASSSGSTRYDEEQEMDSIDTCSLSSMSSGRDSLPEMGEMTPVPERRRPRAPP